MDAPRARNPQAVLFACGQNSVRSPMAESLLRQMFPQALYVKSAGGFPGQARRAGSNSRRRPRESGGPYAAAVRFEAAPAARCHFPDKSLWLWVPAFAGTTKDS